VKGKTMPTEANVGSDLVRIHKVITRALDVSIQNSQANILAYEHQDGFAAYVRALTVLLHAHHSGEDELAFPFWRTRLPGGPFDELGEQHRQMIPLLSQIERWQESGQAAWQPTGLSEVRQTLDALQALWQTHIALEETTVGPENSLKYLTPAENEQLAIQLSQHGQAHSQPGELLMPFIVYNLSGADRDEFIKLLPPVMIQQLIPFTWKTIWSPMVPFLLGE
jgi:hemerythrin-like domain-containing protein